MGFFIFQLNVHLGIFTNSLTGNIDLAASLILQVCPNFKKDFMAKNIATKN
jgi:hypothetical protein